MASQDDTKMNMTAREEIRDRDFERSECEEAEESELETQRKLEKQLMTMQPDLKSEIPRKDIATESKMSHRGQETRSESISLQSNTADNSESTRALIYLCVGSVSLFH